MSSSRLFNPLTRFCPPVAIVSRKTSGLVSAKFDGASASMYWRVKKSTFFFVPSSRPSTLPTDVVQPARGDEVALLDVVEQEVLLPVLVPESLVAFRRRGDRLGGSAQQLHRRRLPQVHVVPPQIHLRLGEPVGVRQHLRGELHERLADPELVGDERVAGSGLAGGEVADDLGALLRGGAQRFGERDRIVGRLRGGFFRGGGLGGRWTWCWLSVSGAEGNGSGVCRREAQRAVGGDAAVEPCRVPEVIEMGDRLAHREEPLLDVELAPKQHRDELGRAAAVHRRPSPPPRARRAAPRDARAAARRAAECRGTAGRAKAARACPAAALRTPTANRGSAPADRRRARPAQTLTFVLIFGSSMSPEISTPRSAEWSEACSGEWPWPSMMRHGRPGRAPHVAVEQAVEGLGQLGNAAPVGVSSRFERGELRRSHPVPAEEVERRVGREARVLIGKRMRGQVLGVRSSRPALRSVPTATRHCRRDRDGSASR